MKDARDHDSALSRIYREGAWPEPARQIDEAILAASRRRARERWPILWRWGPPVAVAATVVVTGSLVLLSRQQPETSSPSLPDTSVQVVDERNAEKKPAEPQAPPAAPPVETPRGFTSTMDTAEAERLDRAQRDMGLKQSPPSESPVKSVIAPLSTDAAQRRPETPQQTRARQSAALREPQPSNAPVSVFGATPAAPVAQAAPAAQAPAPPPAPAPSASVISGVLSNAPSAGSSPTAERAPLTWLEDIRRLKLGGKTDDAARELAEFKKHYPDYPLPDDLR